MTLTLAIPTLSRFDLLPFAVTSALDGSLRPDRIVILDQRGAMPNALLTNLTALAHAHGAEFVHIVPARQISLAAAWNVFIERYSDTLVIGSDDICLHADTLETLVAGAECDPEAPLLVGDQSTDRGILDAFSLFLARRRLHDLIGPFDERFYPAYFEDNDARYRLKLAGSYIRNVPGCTYDHAVSGTLNAMSPHGQAQHWKRFAANEAYYVAKWGGTPWRETFTVPFNGKDSA